MMAVVTMVEYGALPAVHMTAADGAQVTVALFGAHLLSWKTADGKERLFVSACSALDGSKPIRGGVPVIFPQFNLRGPGPKHGFARDSVWRLEHSGAAEDGAASLALSLCDTDLAPAVAAAWPHAFALQLRFTLRGNALEIDFTVQNTGSTALPLAAALHTYFAVGQLDATSVHGLQRQRYTDHHLHTLSQDEATLRFSEKQDRLYQSTPALTLTTADATLQLAQQGYTEWVVWNPGADDARAMADLADDDYLRYLCIEPARIDQQPLAAGARWHGQHRISAS